MTKGDQTQPHHFLVIGYYLFLWSLEFGQLVIVLMRSGYNDRTGQPRSGTGVVTVPERWYDLSGVAERDYFGQQWGSGEGSTFELSRVDFIPGDTKPHHPFGDAKGPGRLCHVSAGTLQFPGNDILLQF